MKKSVLLLSKNDQRRSDSTQNTWFSTSLEKCIWTTWCQIDNHSHVKRTSGITIIVFTERAPPCGLSRPALVHVGNDFPLLGRLSPPSVSCTFCVSKAHGIIAIRYNVDLQKTCKRRYNVRCFNVRCNAVITWFNAVNLLPSSKMINENYLIR